ncbi:BREX-1 system adenine-specific DNA-methyltransferase PglX [Vibrio sp. 10N.222.54.E8]|uniref:BREX-1 system adenine-specific DNA-methyltransferase PglX n=1 Tax=unclassified Vibrio TaxID=2614977 RepID=UPI00354B558E
MNTNKLKAYAPKARIAFMDAVKSRAAKLGIFEDRISEITIDGDSAIIEKEVYTRKQGQQRNQLVKRIEALGTHDGKFEHKDGFNQFINETAFTWFNRLTAIRYMEVNEYLDHGFRVLSKAEGALFGEGFEILNSAADVADELGLNKDQIIDMVLDGNKEEELYRTLLLAQCHQLSEAMPFMFEKLDDATELLLPDNLTKTDSILKDLVNDIPEENWQEIEVIGWLYQFYISEHKDAVIGKVVKREDIPAATQLFTPNWIVKYLVQNSLGRQWLATYPDSELKDKMEYYITPTEQSDDVIQQLKAITPTSIDPEEIKVLDPACGSGHILVEVYEVLREIYLERGYRLREIPELILTKNIYGLDIDDRAAQMAAFAVLMKAREDDKRIFTRDIKLNIHSVQSTENLNINQLWTDLDFDGNKQAGSINDLFAEPQQEEAKASVENEVYLKLLQYIKHQFIDAKSLGSLTSIDRKFLNTLFQFRDKCLETLSNSNQSILTRQAVDSILPIVEQSILLAEKYNVVVANPPYMGTRMMPTTLKKYINNYFPLGKADLFSCFIEKCGELTCDHGYFSMITLQNWMFLSSFETLRESILKANTIDNVNHVGFNTFPSLNSKIALGVAFVVRKAYIENYIAPYVNCNDAPQASDKHQVYLNCLKQQNIQHVNAKQYTKIDGMPIAYWASDKIFELFETAPKFSSQLDPRQGMATTDNERFLRHWFEIDYTKISFNSDTDKYVWFPYVKGGDYRKWYGNTLHVVNYENNGRTLIDLVTEKYPKISDPEFVIKNRKYYFRSGITWTDIAIDPSCRVVGSGHIFDAAGPMAFGQEKAVKLGIAIINSSLCKHLLPMLNPSVHFKIKDFNNLPLINIPNFYQIEELVDSCIDISKDDWDAKEVSLDFKPKALGADTIQAYVASKTNEDTQLTNQLHDNEYKINKVIIEATGLQEELSPKVDLSKLSLFANPDFSFRAKEQSLRPSLIRSSIIQELLSYFIGLSMGRYSLDREGLVYAHSGNNGFKDFVAEGAYNTFPADDDGIVPIADEDWVFEDDATIRFREFVKTVWGEKHLQENLDFVAESLCLDAIKAKKGESSIDTIRRYFSTQFYKDHLKTYRKRPIYWLFSSGKAKAFECLVYLHRYNEGTLSRMRTEYVTPLMGKLESRKNILEDSKATAYGAELRAIDKELKTIEKKQAELVTFDEELKHLAEMKISLDLDDGVKVNYGKFGNLLADVKAIHGKAPDKIK